MSGLQDFIIKNGTLEEYRGSSEDVVVPEGVTKIELWFCNKPERVRRLYLPKSLSRISDSNFNELKNLEYVFIPGSVKSIGRCAFLDCAKLGHVEIENPNTEVDLWAFDGTKFEMDMLHNEGAFILGNTLVKASKEIEKYEIPSQVKIIGRDAFKNAKIKELVVPYGVTKLDICAFSYSSIERISLPETLRTIDAYAFSNCTNLTELTIPKSVSLIGTNAFEELHSCVLTILNECDDEEVFRIAPDSFGRYPPNIKEVRVPYGSAAMRYAMKSGLRVNIFPCEHKKFGNPQKYHYVDDMFCCDGNTLHEYFGHQDVVYIPDGIRKIGKNAFNNTYVNKVYLPQSIKLIEEFGFANCQELIEVVGEGITEMGRYAFYNCEKLQKAEFPELEFCYDISFEGCDNLKRENIIIPDGAYVIEVEFKPCICGYVHKKRNPFSVKV